MFAEAKSGATINREFLENFVWTPFSHFIFSNQLSEREGRREDRREDRWSVWYRYSHPEIQPQELTSAIFNQKASFSPFDSEDSLSILYTQQFGARKVSYAQHALFAMFAVPFLCFLVLFWKSGFSEPLVSQPPVCQSHLWRSCTPSTLNEQAESQHEAGYNGWKKLSNTPAPHISLTVQYPFMADPWDFDVRCRSARWRELKGQGQSLQDRWEASFGRQVAKCQSKKHPSFAKRPRKNHGKIDENAMRNKMEQVPFTLMYGDCLATVHQLTMSPRCLIKLLNQLAWQDYVSRVELCEPFVTFVNRKANEKPAECPKSEVQSLRRWVQSHDPWTCRDPQSSGLASEVLKCHQHPDRSGGLAFHWDMINPGIQDRHHFYDYQIIQVMAVLDSWIYRIYPSGKPGLQ